MFLLSLLACGQGTWDVETWGEEYIEEEIPAEIFEDGCAVSYDTFLVNFQSIALHDGDGNAVAGPDGALVYDMVQPGPTAIGNYDVPATHYDTVYVKVAPGSASAGNATEDQTSAMSSASVFVTGTLTCPSGTISFEWTFDTATDYYCEPDDLTIAAKGAGASQITIHGDHLFYDGLDNADAVVRGEAVVAADADGDGIVTQAELSAVSIASLGYNVGPYSDVTDLGAFIRFLTKTLGHIDGEGHCQVDL